MDAGSKSHEPHKRQLDLLSRAPTCDSAMSFSSLPVELISCIFSELKVLPSAERTIRLCEELDESQTTLAMCSLVSRSWRDIAQPLLFENPVVTLRTSLGTLNLLCFAATSLIIHRAHVQDLGGLPEVHRGTDVWETDQARTDSNGSS